MISPLELTYLYVYRKKEEREERKEKEKKPVRRNSCQTFTGLKSLKIFRKYISRNCSERGLYHEPADIFRTALVPGAERQNRIRPPSGEMWGMIGIKPESRDCQYPVGSFSSR